MKKIEELVKSYANGSLTRRQFVKGLAVLGISMTSIDAILSTTPSAATVSAPKRGGRFRAGLSGFATSDTLDPANLDDIGNYFINWTIRNSLVEVDYKGEAIPELAESWEVSSDATQWVFKLRQGVEFHNGKSFEAEDVIDSINHHRGKDS